MYDVSMFTGFYPGGIPAEDMAKFKRSLMPQVLLFWDQATPELLRELNQILRHNPVTGKDEPIRVWLRLDNPDLNRNPGILQGQLYNKLDAGDVRGVFVGNERDDPWSFRWHDRAGKPADWGNRPTEPGEPSPLMRLAAQVLKTAEALDELVPHIISPGFRMRGFTEDDAPDPGLHSWRELMAPVLYGYDSPINGNGVHFYDYDWWVKDPPMPTPIKLNEDGNLYLEIEEAGRWANALVGARVATWTNVSRFMQAVRFWSGFHHHLTYWDEVNTGNSRLTEQEHIEACIGKHKLLLHHQNGEGYRLGERVAMYCPFTFNGIPNAWPAQYLMSSMATAETVRAHLIEEGYRDA